MHFSEKSKNWRTPRKMSPSKQRKQAIERTPAASQCHPAGEHNLAKSSEVRETWVSEYLPAFQKLCVNRTRTASRFGQFRVFDNYVQWKYACSITFVQFLYWPSVTSSQSDSPPTVKAKVQVSRSADANKIISGQEGSWSWSSVHSVGCFLKIGFLLNKSECNCDSLTMSPWFIWHIA